MTRSIVLLGAVAFALVGCATSADRHCGTYSKAAFESAWRVA